jgi:hypothetical protein
MIQVPRGGLGGNQGSEEFLIIFWKTKQAGLRNADSCKIANMLRKTNQQLQDIHIYLYCCPSFFEYIYYII